MTAQTSTTEENALLHFPPSEDIRRWVDAEFYGGLELRHESPEIAIQGDDQGKIKIGWGNVELHLGA